MQLLGALYGLKRAGLDWGIKVRTDMLLVLGFTWIRDCGETSVFLRGKVVCVVFTDDFVFGGPEPQNTTAFEDVHRHFGFSKKSYDGRVLKLIIGIQFRILYKSAKYVVALINQVDYIKYICRRFEKQQGLKLKPVSTPMKAKFDAKDLELIEYEGVMASVAREHVGKLFWVARVCRIDITHVVSIIARHVTKWSMLDDAILTRCYAYLLLTCEMGVQFVVHYDEVRSGLKQDNYSDSDLSGDPSTTKSCSGWAILIQGEKTKALLDWGSKLQTATARNTPEAEIVAHSDMISRGAAPLSCFLESIWGFHTPEENFIDNEAGEYVLNAGHSRKLAYMKRVQKVSIGLLSDYVNADEVTLSHTTSGDNVADIGTKGLDHKLHWTFCRALGLG
jgi:hypothetical protein